jgi:hypothetical protein
MFVESDDSKSSGLTSYNCIDCDTRHELGSDAAPFVCSVKYSSDEESIDRYGEIIPPFKAWLAQYQVCVTFDPEAETETPAAGNAACVRNNQLQDGETGDINANTTILVSHTDWDCCGYTL